jgi:hypothetical protein
MIQQDVPEKWVYWKLTSDPRTAAHFGFRVYPIIAPQGATRSDSGGVLTFAVFKRQSATWDTTTIDLEASANTMVTAVAVDIYAETYAAARDAANAAASVLRGATGFQFGSMLISSLPNSEQDDIVVPVDGKGLPIYAVGQVYEIRIEQ